MMIPNFKRRWRRLEFQIDSVWVSVSGFVTDGFVFYSGSAEEAAAAACMACKVEPAAFMLFFFLSFFFF